MARRSPRGARAYCREPSPSCNRGGFTVRWSRYDRRVMADVQQPTGEKAERANSTVALVQLALAVLLGIVCFLAASALGFDGRQEELVWFLWFAFMATAAVGLALFVRPAVAFVGAALIVLVQPVAIYLAASASGEIAHPSGSTGGMVSVFIASVLILLGSPAVFAGAWAGVVLRRRRRRPPGV